MRSAPVPQLCPLNLHPTVLCLCSLIFGAITCFTGFLGVVTGAGATRWCRLRTQRADPLVCAVGMLGSAIFICLIFVAAKSSIVGAYVSAGGGCRGSGTGNVGVGGAPPQLDAPVFCPCSDQGSGCPSGLWAWLEACRLSTDFPGA